MLPGCACFLTQVVPGAQLRGVATDDPEETEDADAVHRGVGPPGAGGGGGAEHTLGGVLQGERLEAPIHAPWRGGGGKEEEDEEKRRWRGGGEGGGEEEEEATLGLVRK